jgi:hypothetical protein
MPLRAGALKGRITRDASTLRKPRRRRRGLSAAELANKARRLPWPWVLTAAQERRVVRLLAPGGLPTLRSGRLRVSQQRTLSVLGMASEVVALLNDAHWGPRIRWVYERDSWWGVVEYVYAQRDNLADALEAMSVAIKFGRWRWRLAWCEGHDGHWYVRQPRGRAPDGCPLHAQALRQARWRRSPKQRVALKNVSARRTVRPPRR